jgi:hypothetical protein
MGGSDQLGMIDFGVAADRAVGVGLGKSVIDMSEVLK